MKTFIVLFYQFSVSSNRFIIRSKIFLETFYQVYFVSMFQRENFLLLKYNLRVSLVEAIVAPFTVIFIKCSFAWRRNYEE
jgi:hypothetical protein